jgi:uncharacterized protein YqeY
MEIREKIMTDVKQAMRDRDQVRLDSLRFLQSAIKNREIELRPNAITAEEVMGVIKRLVKQRKESIEQYQAAARQDLVDKESLELKVLEAYLPSQMSKEQVESLVAQVIESTGAKSVKDMGAVMKEVLARAAGTADNRMVSEVVKAKLQ